MLILTVFNDFDDPNREKECRSCKHFLVYFELQQARQIFISARKNLIETKVNKKLEHFFNNLNCAAKNDCRICVQCER